MKILMKLNEVPHLTYLLLAGASGFFDDNRHWDYSLLEKPGQPQE